LREITFEESEKDWVIRYPLRYGVSQVKWAMSGATKGNKDRQPQRRLGRQGIRRKLHQGKRKRGTGGWRGAKCALGRDAVDRQNVDKSALVEKKGTFGVAPIRKISENTEYRVIQDTEPSAMSGELREADKEKTLVTLRVTLRVNR